MKIVAVKDAGPDLDAVRKLFLEYAGAPGISPCLQGFDKELAGLPGEYAAPRGRLLLAKDGDRIAGCVGVRPLDDARCEMKRLYVCPAVRGKGWGRKLARSAIAAAREIGYRRMVLDTLPAMREARGLYEQLGFAPCQPYYNNACVGSDCFEFKL